MSAFVGNLRVSGNDDYNGSRGAAAPGRMPYFSAASCRNITCHPLTPRFHTEET